jgi:hypothetical protein
LARAVLYCIVLYWSQSTALSKHPSQKVWRSQSLRSAVVRYLMSALACQIAYLIWCWLITGIITNKSECVSQALHCRLQAGRQARGPHEFFYLATMHTVHTIHTSLLTMHTVHTIHTSLLTMHTFWSPRADAIVVLRERSWRKVMFVELTTFTALLL